MIPFTVYTAAETVNAFQLDSQPLNVLLRGGDLDLRLIMCPWAYASQRLKRHLDRFSRFCRAHERDQKTKRHRDTPRCSVCGNRPHLAVAAMRPKIRNGMTMQPMLTTFENKLDKPKTHTRRSKRFQITQPNARNSINVHSHKILRSQAIKEIDHKVYTRSRYLGPLISRQNNSITK